MEPASTDVTCMYWQNGAVNALHLGIWFPQKQLQPSSYNDLSSIERSTPAGFQLLCPANHAAHSLDCNPMACTGHICWTCIIFVSLMCLDAAVGLGGNAKDNSGVKRHA